MNGIKLMLAAALALTGAAARADGELDGLWLEGETDRALPVYSIGDAVNFRVRFTGEARDFPSNTWKLVWRRSGDDGVRESGEFPLDAASLTNTFRFSTWAAKPGFIRLHAEIHSVSGTQYRCGPALVTWWRNTIFCDLGAAVDPEKIVAAPEPADFDAFWARTLELGASVPVKELERREVTNAEGVTGVRTFIVKVACAGRAPTTGYLTVPQDASKDRRYPVEVRYQGYGTARAQRPGTSKGGEDTSVDADRLIFWVNAHGWDVEHAGDERQEGPYYDAFLKGIAPSGQNYAFDAKENASPDTCYFRDMALRAVRAVEYMKTLPEWNGRDVWVLGGSQGGMQATWAAALAPAVTKCTAYIMWNCDTACESLGRDRGDWYIPFAPALPYFDSANHARRVPADCFVNVSRAGLGDWTCAPAGLALYYRNLRCRKRITWLQGSTHGYIPERPTQKIELSNERTRP